MGIKYPIHLLALLSLSQTSFAQKKPVTDEKKPNVLFVMSDQHRRQAVGFMNEDPVITPNLDSFSKEAVTFTKAYSAHPVSGPNRACLFSGKYTQNNKVFGNDCRLEDDGNSMGALFKKSGYSTGYIGKWHLDGHEGGKYSFVPRERRLGFQYWLVSQGHRHFDGRYYGDKDSLIVTGRWMPDYETEKALEFLKNRNGERDGRKPFCLVVSYAPPHNGMGPGFQDKYNIGHWNASLKDLPIRKGGGFAAPKRFEEMYEPADQLPRRENVEKVDNKDSYPALPGYFGAITSIDENFGKLIQELKDSGEWENTIVVYTSDHGELLGSHGRMYKDLWYEESIGVPLMISYPAKLKPKKTEQLINSIDVLPTLLELAGIEIPEVIDGTSYADYMNGKKKATTDKIFFQFDRGVLNDNGPDRYYRAVRTKRYTYVAAMSPYYDQFVGKNKEVLYDNEKDPYQLHPIFLGGGHDKIMNELRAAVMDWCEQTHDPFFSKYWKPVSARKRILMEDLGVSQNEDVTPLVLKALQQADFKDAVLVFPKGTYHFYPEKAVGKYHAVTNHDNSYKYFAFPLIGCANIEIDGGGSDFIFHGVMTPFLVENSTGIRLKNFSIDWEEPFYLQAEVLTSNPSEQYMDIAVNPMTKTEFEGNRLGFVTNGLSLPFLGESMVFDPKTNAVAYNAQAYLLNGAASRKTFDQSLGGNNYRIKARFAKTPAPAGLIYVFKGPNRSNRLAPAIHLANSSNLHLDELNIYHAGGMGVIAEKSENIHLDKVNVKLREGSGRMVSTTADATHFCNCKGELVIENCLFENMLDDASNIHGTYIKISELVDKHTIRAGVNHVQQFDYNFASPGDKIEFITNETLLPMAPATVKSFKKINDHLFELSFVEELPTALKVNDAVDNVTWYPTTTFRNNVVRNNRARSILISTRNKTVIEGNTFSSMMTSILFEGDLNHWYESGAVDDVLIRNNIFYDCVYGGGKGSVIWINPRMKQTVRDQPYEKNIVIEDNEFRTFDNSILRALSVDGLIFRNNKIIESGTYPKLWPDLPAIEVRDGLNTLIQNNSFEGKEKARIVIDENSSRSLKIDKKQKGFIVDRK